MDERGVVHVKESSGFLLGFRFGEFGLERVEDSGVARQKNEGLGVRGLSEDAVELAGERVFEIGRELPVPSSSLMVRVMLPMLEC